MPITTPVINYTNRDFESIRNDLINYVKKYYPDNFKDFNEASFGSLVLDMVAYVGDSLSYYTDFNFNESNIDTAIKFDNVVAGAKKLGYKYTPTYASYGRVALYILVPALANAPNRNYMPVLKKGTKFSTPSGKVFSLLDDVDFANENNETVVGQVDSSTGAPTTYAVKAYGRVISGELAIFQTTVGDYQRFRRIKVPGSNIVEIISVFDSGGNKWYEVESLTQNTIYVPIINRNTDKYTVPNILKPAKVNRRFVMERESSGVYLRFGGGSNDVETAIIDPSKVVLDVFGKSYLNEVTFDPTTLIKSDSMGLAPENTIITVLYRINSTQDVNSAANTVTIVSEPNFEFRDRNSLSTTTIETVSRTLEVTNEEPIVGSVSLPTIEEIKLRAKGAFSAQDRAVTKEDYIALAYQMPANFGAIKRINIAQDKDSINQRNLNLYVVSDVVENGESHLTETSTTIKQNLKTWLQSRKMINDTVDILDAKIVNFGVRFTVAKMPGANSYSTHSSCVNALKSLFFLKADIGEPIIVSDIYKALKDVGDVLDVITVDIVPKLGANYAQPAINLDDYRSGDGRVVYCPFDVIYELKYLDSDIAGEVV